MCQKLKVLLELRPRPPWLHRKLLADGHIKPIGDPRGKLSRQQQDQLKKRLRGGNNGRQRQTIHQASYSLADLCLFQRRYASARVGVWFWRED